MEPRQSSVTTDNPAMTDRDRQQILLSSKHHLGFAEFGSPQGLPVFYCHGFPASRLEGKLYEQAALRNHVRMIVADRPGFGLSDPKSLPTVADWPDDLVELADHLNIQRFTVLGVSGGGPYALACAYRIPDRLVSVGVVCGLGPVYQQWALEKMKWPARLGFSLAKHAPSLLPIVYGNLTATLMRWRPEVCQTLLTISAPESDHQVLKKDEVMVPLFASLREALRNGTQGVLADFRRYANDWGFHPQQIDLPINLWHGTADSLVPIEHAYYFDKTLPHVSSNYIPKEGHFSLPIRFMDDIFWQLTCPKKA